MAAGGVDPRTVQRYLRGAPVLPAHEASIALALRSLGLTELIRSEQGSGPSLMSGRLVGSSFQDDLDDDEFSADRDLARRRPSLARSIASDLDCDPERRAAILSELGETRELELGIYDAAGAILRGVP